MILFVVLKPKETLWGKNKKTNFFLLLVKTKYHHHGSKSIVMVTNDLWGSLISLYLMLMKHL